MFRQSFVICTTLFATAALGVWCGNRLALGACEVRCITTEEFHSLKYSGDPDGHHYRMTSVTSCNALFWTTKTGMQYTSIDSTTEKYRELKDFSCAYQCFMNGGVFAESDCTEGTPFGDELEIVCYDHCTDTAPQP